jgi:hypothetical protein
LYEGEFKDGTKHGFGKWQKGMGDGADIYHGNYYEDKRHGYGSFTWGLTGANYRGQFQVDIMNGYGIYTWKEGSIYEGEFVDG